jgi:DNA repair exonuclease SbcCD ATPase subunit
VSGRWLLSSVTVRDLLGFQGERTFEFGSGLQVIEAANHTGKTSLALALLWGLTGEIPKLARITKTSFRLTNKHAGKNAEPAVTIVLQASDGGSLELRRRYVAGRKGADEVPELRLGEEELAGPEADARLLAELGLSPATLEGCGVVLQDHRLKLITGKEGDISGVVNDMLGLEALSDVVPTLADLAREARALHGEVDSYLAGADPVRRWEEKEADLYLAWRQCENAALETGLKAEQLEDAAALTQTELSEVAEALDAKPPRKGVAVPGQVQRLRKALLERRKASPAAQECAALAERHRACAQLAEDCAALAAEWRAHDEALLAEAAAGAVDEAALARAVAQAEGLLKANEAERRSLGEEQQLLSAAYQHLLHHGDAAACPLCRQAIEAGALRDEVKERLDARLVARLDELAAADEEARADQEQSAERLTRIQELRRVHNTLVAETARVAERLQQEDWPLDAAPLFVEAGPRATLVAGLEQAVEAQQQEAERLQAEEEAARQAAAHEEDELFEPLTKQLNRVMEQLVPLLAAAQAIEAHGALRDQARAQADALHALADEARAFALQLKRIVRAVSEDQEARAAAAVQARLPFVAEFFAKVAGNPDYTGLDIKTSVVRDKVVYRMRATSSRLAALDDAVGHVLSEGDLSAAGMALLLGLASGDSHRLGFLLLDDPAQGMDPTLQENFARELGRMADRPQVIILTHQPDFARALAAQGAETRALGRWEGGRHHDA